MLEMLLFTLFITCSAREEARFCPENCICQNITASNGSAVDVNCSGCDVSQYWGFLSSVTMHKLNLSRCSLASFAQTLEPAPSLYILDISYNTISEKHHLAASFPNLQVLNISHNSLLSIPYPLPNTLQFLFAANNKISLLDINALKKLTYLQALYLDNNNVKKICCLQNDLFYRLELLSLSANNITNLKHLFSNCTLNISYLVLSNNKIRHISLTAFRSLHNLQHLDLSNNLISSVEAKAFNYLTYLRHLILSGNKLLHLTLLFPDIEWLDVSYNSFSSMSESETNMLYPLEVFLIGGNPWYCNCSILNLKELYDTREYQLKYFDFNRSKFVPTCTGPPALAGESWDVLSNDVFECNSVLPVQIPSTTNIQMESLQLKEKLTFEVINITSTSMVVIWDAAKNRLSNDQVVEIHIHKFGLKNSAHEVVVPRQRQRYTLQHLASDSAYVVCAQTYSDLPDGNKIPSLNLENCFDVMTLSNVESISVIGYFLSAVVILTSTVLLIKCTCTLSYSQSTCK